MTTMPIELPAAAEFQSPMARILQQAARWQEQRHQRHLARLTLEEIPEHLRHDIGLDGGAPLQRDGRVGRTFIHNNHPDSTLSDWRW